METTDNKTSVSPDEQKENISEERFKRILQHLSLVEGESLYGSFSSVSSWSGRGEFDVTIGLTISSDNIKVNYFVIPVKKDENDTGIEKAIEEGDGEIIREIALRVPDSFSFQEGLSGKGKVETIIPGYVLFTFPQEKSGSLSTLRKVLNVITDELGVQVSGENTASDLLELICTEAVDSEKGKETREIAGLVDKLWDKISAKTEKVLTRIDARIEKYSGQTPDVARKEAIRRMRDYFGRSKEPFEKMYKLAEESLSSSVDEMLSFDGEGNFKKLRLAKNVTPTYFSGSHLTVFKDRESPAVLFMKGDKFEERAGSGYGHLDADEKLGQFCLVIRPEAILRTYFLFFDIDHPDSLYRSSDDSKAEKEKMDFRGAILLKAARIFWRGIKERIPIVVGDYDEGRILPKTAGELSFTEDEVESIITVGSLEVVAKLERLFPRFKGKFRNPKE